MNHKEWGFTALTDIWTGNARGKGDSLILTGLLGSIRWWFEVLVRGLNGKACDPTVPSVRCPDHDKKPIEPGHHCVVCELFGCTGWVRKFRLMVLDEQGNVVQSQIKASMNFTLRLIPLRPICDEEWCLLDMTLRLIADYGAIGGKTVLKPSDEEGRRNAFHHKDFGLIQYIPASKGWQCGKTLDALRSYVRKSQWRRDFDDKPFAWASLLNFWFVKDEYLARKNTDESNFNKFVGRHESKRCIDCGAVHNPGDKCHKTDMYPRRHSDQNPSNRPDEWLAGRQQESKKVFSFKHPEKNGRTFGFVYPETVSIDEIKKRLTEAWSRHEFQFKTGEDILQELCRSRASSKEGGSI